ncbi:MAG: hypothetical protein AAF515_14650 [Pseudomonadota bacterium]
MSLQFHWEDEFTTAERRVLVDWLEETQAALEGLVGTLPFRVHLFLHRTRANEPVPWAHTERGSRQGVHFHVDPSFPLAAFRADWTAPHELAHLILPYVGRQHAWFAEGFASFMQYRVMQAMGVLDEPAMRGRYKRNVTKAQRDYANNPKYSDQPFADAAPMLRSDRRYPTMYWGGAGYFLRVERALAERDRSLIDVLRAYVACCRARPQQLERLVAELDGICSATVWQEELRRFRLQRGFPDVSNTAAD